MPAFGISNVEAISIGGSVLAFLAARVSAYLSLQREIVSLYDRLVECRLGHPNVMECAWQWKPACWARVYDQSGPDGTKWADYYAYIELCLAYCNAVLESRWHTMDCLVFGRGAARRERLVRLIMTEHWPIFADMSKVVMPSCTECGHPGDAKRPRPNVRFARKPKFISPAILNYIRTSARRGWHWQAEHCRLVWGETGDPRCGSRQSVPEGTSTAILAAGPKA